MFKAVYLMTESAHHLTADELSRGSDFWRSQKRRARTLFTQTIGNDRLQKILDFEYKCDEAIRRCQTYSPCSRTIYLPNGGRL